MRTVGDRFLVESNVVIKTKIALTGNAQWREPFWIVSKAHKKFVKHTISFIWTQQKFLRAQSTKPQE